MKARRPDPMVAAAYSQLDTIRRVLRLSRVADAAVDDLASEVVWAVYVAARHGGVAWKDPAKLHAFVWIVAKRAAFRWHGEHVPEEEFQEREHAERVASAEDTYEAAELLAVLKASTTDERHRALIAFAEGEPVEAIAAREGITPDGVRSRIYKAREDFARALEGKAKLRRQKNR